MKYYIVCSRKTGRGRFMVLLRRFEDAKKAARIETTVFDSEADALVAAESMSLVAHPAMVIEVAARDDNWRVF